MLETLSRAHVFGEMSVWDILIWFLTVVLYVSNTQVHCNRWFFIFKLSWEIGNGDKILKCYFLCFYLKSLKITKDFAKIHTMCCDIVTYLDTKYVQPSCTSLSSVTESEESGWRSIRGKPLTHKYLLKQSITMKSYYYVNFDRVKYLIYIYIISICLKYS